VPIRSCGRGVHRRRIVNGVRIDTAGGSKRFEARHGDRPRVGAAIETCRLGRAAGEVKPRGFCYLCLGQHGDKVGRLFGGEAGAPASFEGGVDCTLAVDALFASRVFVVQLRGHDR
jgi:hypothetical protein